MYRPRTLTDGAHGYAASPTRDNRAIISRIIASYNLAIANSGGAKEGMWLGIFQQHQQDIHAALLSEDEERVWSIFSDPGSNDLLYGIDPHFRGFHQTIWSRDKLFSYCIDGLIRLCEATGACRVYCAEHHGSDTLFVSIEERLNLLDSAIGVRLDFPNPYPNEFGIQTSRGIMAWKAPDSIYQAWRARHFSKGGNVLEIGGGVGRAAYYGIRLGIPAYSIVDLPLSLAIQAYFLASALGNNAVSLFGEETQAPIRLAPPAFFLSNTDEYEVILNSNAMTEFDADSVSRYWEAVSTRAKVFLSMNHEANDIRMWTLSGHTAERFPHWIRDGYVEEIVRF